MIQNPFSLPHPKPTSLNNLLAIQLQNGDLLLGGLSEIPPTDSPILVLGYNTPKGTFASTEFVEIPVAEIVDLQVVPLGNEYKQLHPHNYPNPLAQLIAFHNRAIAQRHTLQSYGYTVKEFKPGVTIENGITLDDWYYLYQDLDRLHLHFSDSTTLALTTPFFSVSREVSDSSHPLPDILRTIKGTDTSISRRMVDESILEGWNGFFSGQLQSNDVIEGEHCYAYVVKTGDLRRVVVMKKKSFKMPLGFVSLIHSEMTFLGERIPISLQDADIQYEDVFLVRVVAYIPNTEAIIR
jgi:hypothetical protein